MDRENNDLEPVVRTAKQDVEIKEIVQGEIKQQVVSEVKETETLLTDDHANETSAASVILDNPVFQDGSVAQESTTEDHVSGEGHNESILDAETDHTEPDIKIIEQDEIKEVEQFEIKEQEVSEIRTAETEITPIVQPDETGDGIDPLEDIKRLFDISESDQGIYRENLRNRIAEYRRNINEYVMQINDLEDIPENIATRSGMQTEYSELVSDLNNEVGAGIERSGEHIVYIDRLLDRVREEAPDDMVLRRDMMRAQDRSAEFRDELMTIYSPQTYDSNSDNTDFFSIEDNDIEDVAENTAENTTRKSNGLLKGIVKAPFAVALNTAKSAVKSTVSKANPFDKPINKNDVTDSGVESIRLAYTSAKKGVNSIKTVGSTIKTTKRTVKTTKDVVKGTGTAIYRTADFAKNTVVITYKVTEAIVTNVVAALTNPFVLIALAFLLIVSFLIGSFVFLLGGVASAASSNKQAMTMAAGIGNTEKVAEQYAKGEEWFNKYIEEKHDGYNNVINDLRYDPNDNKYNDLVKVWRYRSGYPTPEKAWEHSKEGIPPSKYRNLGAFADPEWKNTLTTDVWEMQVKYREIAAIAYVYLEKQKAGGEVNGIYRTELTEDVFREIADLCVQYEVNVYHDQTCPGDGCMFDNDPRVLHCDHKHDFVMVNINFNTKEDIMEELGFTEYEIKWAELTYQGFDHNTGIPEREEDEDW